jgi:hypothetical protein
VRAQESEIMTTDPGRRLLGVAASARRLNCSAQSIRNWRAQNIFPHPVSCRSRGWPKWTEDQIEAFARGEAPAANPAPAEPFLDGGDIAQVAKWGVIQ